jgi:hypothetical protein
MSTRNISLKCVLCNTNFIISKYYLKLRDENYYNFCPHCYDSYIRRKQFLCTIPKNLWKDIILNNEIDFDIGIKIFGNSSKIKIYFKGNCVKCNKEFKARYDKLRDRKIFPMVKMCTSCTRLETSRSEIARLSNSRAQLITQNIPEIKSKNIKRSKKWWKNLSKDKKDYYLKSFVNNRLRMQNDPEYARNIRIKSSVIISGEYYINNEWIKFDSGYELLYLHSLINKNLTIKRCDFSIPYGKFKYNPDFLIIDNCNNKKSIIEIKGSFYKNRIKEKGIAANDYIIKNKIADEYIIYDQNYLLKNNILIKESSTFVWKQIRNIYNGNNVRFTNEKHREIAEIGRSRWYKKNKNKINIAI